MMGWLDRFPFKLLLVVAMWLAVAPIVPEPHLVEKWRMLVQGTLVQSVEQVRAVVARSAKSVAPIVPEPHLVEKWRMLVQGTLRQPIDIFDLFLHTTPLVLLALRLWRDAQRRHQRPPPA